MTEPLTLIATILAGSLTGAFIAWSLEPFFFKTLDHIERKRR